MKCEVTASQNPVEGSTSGTQRNRELDFLSFNWESTQAMTTKKVQKKMNNDKTTARMTI